MATLEDLTRGASVRGILPDGLVTVVDLAWYGSTCVELTYKDPAGRLSSELLYRDREPSLEITARSLQYNGKRKGDQAMITEQTIKEARTAAEELRQRGEPERAQAIEALIDAVREGAPPRPAREQIGDFAGVDGRPLRQWVQEGRYQAYRAGTLIVSSATVEDYIRRAGPSLDLDVISDDDAARLVAEGRTKGEATR